MSIGVTMKQTIQNRMWGWLISSASSLRSFGCKEQLTMLSRFWWKREVVKVTPIVTREKLTNNMLRQKNCTRERATPLTQLRVFSVQFSYPQCSFLCRKTCIDAVEPSPFWEENRWNQIIEVPKYENNTNKFEIHKLIRYYLGNECRNFTESTGLLH